MFEVSQFFLYKLLFMTELLASEFLFTFRLRKRRSFAVRYALSVCLCYVCAVFFPMPDYTAFYLIVVFVTLFALTVLVHFFCYAETFLNILFCLIAAYTVQHIAYCLNNCMLIMSGLSSNVFGIYTGEVMSQDVPPARYVFGYIFTFAVYYLTFYAFFLLYGNRIKRNTDLRLKHLSLLFVTGLALFVSIVVNSIIVYSSLIEPVVLGASVYNALCCVFIMHTQFGMLNTRRLENELQTVYHMLRESQEQFVLAKENIDLINMKCHDLKHQIRQIGRAKLVSDDALNEIADVISFYDTEVKTGNDALDIILTEKSMYCYKNKIRMSCLADGSRLDFLSDAEIYALFGNAIDNAISAVKNIGEEEKRFIGLTVRKVRDFVSVNLNNCYEGKLKYGDNGLPLTTKGDDAYHGFGLKSIAYVTEKHNGCMTVGAENNVFNLNIIFPVNE